MSRQIPELPVEPFTPEQGRRELALRTRRSFLWGGAAALTGLAGLGWLRASPLSQGLPRPLRGVLEFNEWLSRGLFSRDRLVPEFDRERADEPEPNGLVGLDTAVPDGIDPASWAIAVTGLAGGERTVTLADLQALPKREMTTEFKCIEGWSQVVHWGGARFSEFAARYPPSTPTRQPLDLRNRPADVPGYVSLSTPDKGYYVSLDADSALHPQTLLAWEMNGEPLSSEHGAPLRLVIPVKYGIKSIKRIGAIAWADARGPDYWAERGYDWYAGH